MQPRQRKLDSAGRRRATRPSAFSLLELTLVIVILATLAAVAIPRYASALGNYRVNAAARKVAADIQLAQARARATSSSQTISFTLATNQYQIIGMPDPDHPANTYTVTLGVEPFVATIRQVAFGNGTTLTFNGFGVPLNGGAVTLTGGGVTKTITVDAANGNVTYQ